MSLGLSHRVFGSRSAEAFALQDLARLKPLRSGISLDFAAL
jgi:hypothetical protein